MAYRVALATMRRLQRSRPRPAHKWCSTHRMFESAARYTQIKPPTVLCPIDRPGAGSSPGCDPELVP
jgi:hypothetical protein